MTTKALAKFTAELCYEKLSAHSIEMAKKCLLDWLGIAIRGSQEKPVRIIHDVILQGDAPQANIFGSLPAKKGRRLNAALSTALLPTVWTSMTCITRRLFIRPALLFPQRWLSARQNTKAVSSSSQQFVQATKPAAA